MYFIRKNFAFCAQSNNEAPTNKDVTFTEEESKDMTYGDKAAKVKVVDYAFVNPILNNWIDQWNRTINN